MAAPVLTSVRVFLPVDDVTAPQHWIVDSAVASPMSRWPEHRASRRSWGIGALARVVVEVEASDGTRGVGITSGGTAVAAVILRHLGPLVVGTRLDLVGVADAWDRMWAASLPYGRRGLGVHALSALDLALWDGVGRHQDAPVWSLLGELHHPELPVYATTPQPDAARALGFVGAKLPLPAGAAEGAAGVRANVETVRAAAGHADEDFLIAVDCFMSQDVETAVLLGEQLADLGVAWLEEALPPDDLWGQAELRRRLAGRIAVATGEHEATRWGFRLLLEAGAADQLQPDPSWCGGMTELRRIIDLAAAAGVPVVPHGSSVYGYAVAATRPDTPYAEFLLLSADGRTVVPPLAPLLVGEPLPKDGRLQVGELPGFGVEIDPSADLVEGRA